MEKQVIKTIPCMDAKHEEEGKPPGDPLEQKVPLKRGAGEMEFDVIRAAERQLAHLLDKHPDHFRALETMVRGDDAAVTDRQRRELRRWLFLDEKLQPLPQIRAVMEAALRDTREGTVIVDPIHLNSEQDAAVMQRLENLLAERRQGGVKRLLHDLRRDENERGGGPAR